MKSPAGRGHTLVFRTVEYQLVIKYNVETRPKKACVSTLYLKWILIISELQNTPWPRPANAHIDFVKETLPPPLSELNCDCRLRIDPSAADAEWPGAGLVRLTASSR